MVLMIIERSVRGGVVESLQSMRVRMVNAKFLGCDCKACSNAGGSFVS